jgi:PIN domain nuclease of toxin-antitoxin system
VGEVRVLVDTHALLWWLADDKRLSRRARKTIADEETEVLVSAACVWEAAIKASLGKLGDPTRAVSRLPSIIPERGFAELQISAAHAVQAADLPRIHRDPFDRMLVAQSMIESAPVVTNDPDIRRYGVKTIW